MPHSRAFQGSGTDEVFSFISWTPFAFLPIFIAITASKHFKVNTFVAVLCCAAIMNPDWGAMAGRIADGETIRLFGIALSPTTYTSTVIPPLLLVWLVPYQERYLKKLLKGSAENLLVPLISAVVMVPLTLLIVGPLSAAGANGIANGYNWLVSVAPAVAAAIIGGFWQVAVIFGIHWGITPVVLANFEQYGYDSFQAFQTAAVIAQVGAALGVFLKTKSKQLRGVAGSAAVTGIFGITEPTIYGVALRLKRPFILACIAGAAGAIVISLFGSRYYAYAGLPGMLTIVNAQSPDNPTSQLGQAIGSAIAFFGAMALVYFIGFNDPVDSPTEEEQRAEGTAELQKSAQVGASEWGISLIMYTLAVAAQNAMVVYPNQDDAIEFNTDRIRPAIELCEPFDALRTGRAHDEKMQKLVYRTASLYMRWANSAPGLRSKPCPNLFLDEFDLYPPGAADQARHDGEQQVEGADVLVVGREEPTRDEARLVVGFVVMIVSCGVCHLTMS